MSKLRSFYEQVWASGEAGVTVRLGVSREEYCGSSASRQLIDWIIFSSLKLYKHVSIELIDRHPLQADNSKQENFRGRCLMVLAMAAFAIEDSVIKMLSVTLPVGQILILLGLAGALIFFLLALGLKKRIWTPEILTWPMHLRIMSEILGRIFYSTALAFTPLASSTMILQATPLAVVIGASFFSKKKSARCVG